MLDRKILNVLNVLISDKSFGDSLIQEISWILGNIFIAIKNEPEYLETVFKTPMLIKKIVNTEVVRLSAL